MYVVEHLLVLHVRMHMIHDLTMDGWGLGDGQLASMIESIDAKSDPKRARLKKLVAALLPKEQKKQAEVAAAAALAATKTHSDAEALGWGVPISTDESTLVLYISCHAERHLWADLHQRMHKDGHHNYIIVVGRREGHSIPRSTKSHVKEVEARDTCKHLSGIK